MWSSFKEDGRIEIRTEYSTTHRINLTNTIQITILDGKFVIGEMHITFQKDLPYLFRYLADKLDEHFNDIETGKF